tara:strand:- start:166 stop:531 length:366 start_codon:yes stop_codon:yes gene_type:complete
METSPYAHCYDCWKEINGWDRNKSDQKYVELQKIIQGLLVEGASTEMSHLREKVKDLEEESHRLRMDLLEAQSNIEEAMSQIILSPTFLKRLITFCHPDKNPSRDQEASEITRELLKVRGK